MPTLLRNIRYALRGFARNPVFTAVALLSLGLGIGANTAIFSLLDRVLLRQLPVRDAAQLVHLQASGPRQGSVLATHDSDYCFSYPMYLDIRDRAPVFDGVLAWFPAEASMSVGTQTEMVTANLVSGNFFDVLGSKTTLGRPILPEDAAAADGAPVAVLTYQFWTSRFNRDPNILNQKIAVNNVPMTVVGVSAPGFQGVTVGERASMFVPITMVKSLVATKPGLENRRAMWLMMLARLKPGIHRAAAETTMNAFWRPILEDEAKSIPSQRGRDRYVALHLNLVSASTGISAPREAFGTPLVLLMGLVGLVLLIACANVANLLLARAAGRKKEIAVRLALGASRGDIIRHIMAESLILAFGGGALGLLFASWTGNLLVRLVPIRGFTDAITADPDLPVLLFAGGISILSALLFGIVPALQAARSEVYATLKDQSLNVSAGTRQVLVRKVLVAGQVALSLVLLIGAGLFLRTLQNLQSINAGFRTDHIISFSTNPALGGYRADAVVRLYDGILERLRALPGARSVALKQTPILTGSKWYSGLVIPGRTPLDSDPSPNVDSINPGYFSAFGIPLLSGRDFTNSDLKDGTLVAIINQTFAQVFFPGTNPIGRQMYVSGEREKKMFEIVGVVRDSKYADLREKPEPFVFFPYAQRLMPRTGTFYVRTSNDPARMVPAIREAVRELDASLPVFEVKTMQDQIDESVFAERMVSSLSIWFGLLATLLASIGLYGVMAYMVTRRTREIGVRMALGASRGAVLKLVLSEVMLVVGAGVAIALLAAIPLGRVARSMLYGVSPNDPSVLAGATLLLLAVAALAGYVPAARATRVDPLTALRHD